MILPSKKRSRQILVLALPIIGGMVSQNILNLVDTYMVGRLGDEALAAVGVASFANFMVMSLVTGLSAGVQAMSSRRLGEGKLGTAVPLNGGLLLALVLSIPLTIFAFVAAPTIFPYLNADSGVIEQGVPYWRMRSIALVAVGMKFSFRGYWNAIHMSGLYMRTLVVMHVCNVVLNVVLIFGNEPLGIPAMGTAGAGLGTALATFIGLGYYIYLGLRHAREAGFLAGLPDRTTMVNMVRLSGPSCVQNLFFSSGMTILFWIVGRVGTAETAAANVLIQFMLVAVLPGIAFGIAAATFVGESLGKGDKDAARAWGWDVAKLGSVVVGFITLPGFLFPDLFLSPFLTDPATLELASFPLQLNALAMPIDTIGLVLLNAHMGAGATRRSMMVSVFMQWGIGLPLAYLLGPALGFGLIGIFVAQGFYRSLMAGAFSWSWRGNSWTDIDL